jgi:hypothetical protein
MDAGLMFLAPRWTCQSPSSIPSASGSASRLGPATLVRSDDLDVTSPSEVESLDVVRRARYARSVDRANHLMGLQQCANRAHAVVRAGCR